MKLQTEDKTIEAVIVDISAGTLNVNASEYVVRSYAANPTLRLYESL